MQYICKVLDSNNSFLERFMQLSISPAADSNETNYGICGSWNNSPAINCLPSLEEILKNKQKSKLIFCLLIYSVKYI